MEIAAWLFRLDAAQRGISRHRDVYLRAMSLFEDVAIAARDLAFAMRCYLSTAAEAELTKDEFYEHPLWKVHPQFHSWHAVDFQDPSDGAHSTRLAGHSSGQVLYVLLRQPEAVRARRPRPPGFNPVPPEVEATFASVAERLAGEVDGRVESARARLEGRYRLAKHLSQGWHQWPLAVFKDTLDNLPADAVPDGAGPRVIEKLGILFSSLALGCKAESLGIPTPEDRRAERKGARGRIPKLALWRDFGQWMKANGISARRVARHSLAGELLLPQEDRNDETALKGLENKIAQRTGT